MHSDSELIQKCIQNFLLIQSNSEDIDSEFCSDSERFQNQYRNCSENVLNQYWKVILFWKCSDSVLMPTECKVRARKTLFSHLSDGELFPSSLLKELCVNQIFTSLTNKQPSELMLHSYFTLVQLAMEFFPFYAQCFLNLGMSYERWVNICRPFVLEKYLSYSRKLTLYILISVACLFAPMLVLMDYFINDVSVIHQIY